QLLQAEVAGRVVQVGKYLRVEHLRPQLFERDTEMRVNLQEVERRIVRDEMARLRERGPDLLPEAVHPQHPRLAVVAELHEPHGVALRVGVQAGALGVEAEDLVPARQELAEAAEVRVRLREV